MQQNYQEFINFILHEIITSDDKDPLWIENLIRHISVLKVVITTTGTLNIFRV